MSDERATLTEAQAERLGRYRARGLAPAEREAFERKALADDALAAALYEDEALEALVRPRRPAAPRWRELALAATFLAVFGAAWWWQAGREAPAPGPVRRGAASAVRLLEPLGAIAGPPARFAWTSDPGAAGYRFELSDAEGRVVATRLVPDTALAAASLGAPLPAAGTWGVVPIAPDGAERPAPPLARFTVAPR